jgi:hypothetical protein
VQDYRPVNAWTIKNRYPLPLIPQLVDHLRGATLFTGFDVEWGYNEVLIKPQDRWKAGFITNKGLYEPTVMFFGLTNSPATFQTMINTIFRDLIDGGSVTIYMDDIAIHTGPKEGESHEEHLTRHRTLVRQVLERLQKNNLYLNPEKCTFKQDHLDFLGVRVANGVVEMEQAKVDKVKDWIRPRNVQEVRKFLGFTGYYRHFIKDYSKVARPLLDLTKQATPWHWEGRHQQAFENLRDKMVSKPVLHQPDFGKTFYLQTDASKYGVGAVLSQDEGTQPVTPQKRHPVAYYSATFSPTEQNYDAHDLEFLGVMKSIDHWRPYLIWTKEPFVIETDHKNLTYWKSPRKLTGRTARWHEKLQDYNFRIIHVQGKNNTPADALSRPNQDNRQQEERKITLLPSETFLNLADTGNEDSLEYLLVQEQGEHSEWLKEQGGQCAKGTTLWTTEDGRSLVPPSDTLKRRIMHAYHDGLTGHPGRDETTRKVLKKFSWPGARRWIEQYVKGCATCQQNKNLTHRVHIPLYKITVPTDAPPFTQVAMDLITGLPKSRGYDSILTIVDHGCSRGALFLPCQSTIMGPQIAKLYYQHLYPWFGLPRRLITDRDPHFTSHFGRALAKELGIS